MKFSYICNECNKEYKSDEILYTCSSCASTNQNSGEFRKGNLRVVIDPNYLKSLKDKKDLTYLDFFPYQINNDDPLVIGPTPIVRPLNLGKKYSLNNLSFKLDSQLISGSFKDRASQLVAFQALKHNVKSIALASTGNAGAGMSCLGAAYNLDVILFVPENAPFNKLMQSVLYGATVVPVKGSYDDAFNLSLYYTEKYGGINRNTGYNPMTVEGKKSISIELYLQLKENMPDVIYVPVGDGSIYSGVVKGLFDLQKGGFIEKIPYVVCAQSQLSDAISKAFETNNYLNVEATTRADSISVSSPANGRMAVSYIKESNSWATVVSDKEILDSQLELAKQSGILVEPAAACAWAAAKKDKEYLVDQFGQEANILVLLTGNGLKDMAVFDNVIKKPKAIENSIEGVDKLFGTMV
jgi:threonine synthase